MKLTYLVVFIALIVVSVTAQTPDGPFNISSPGPSGAGLQLLGQSAKFRVHLNSSDTTNFVQVTFGKVEELDANNRSVQGHRIVALESLAANLEEGTAVTEGTNVSYVQITILMSQTGPQFKPCSGNTPDDLTGKIIITCYITSSNTSFPFGFNNSITVGANALKFNIEAVKWPFCNANNKLSVDVFLTTNGQNLPRTKVDKPDRPDGTRPDLKAVKGTRARLEFAPGKVAAAVFPAYATDGPDGNKTMNIDIAPLGADVGKTGFAFVFPAADYIYYDPLVSYDPTTNWTTIASDLGLTVSPSPSPSPSSSPAPKKSAGSKVSFSGLLVAAAAALLALAA